MQGLLISFYKSDFVFSVKDYNPISYLSQENFKVIISYGFCRIGILIMEK